MSGLLPTLQLRKRNYGDLYTTAICRKCKKKEENFKHLTSCEVDESHWSEKKYSIAKEIWWNLDAFVQKKISQDNIYLAFAGGSIEDRHKKRNYLARGLIEKDLTAFFKSTGITRKEIELITLEWWDKWHSFFQEEIWLQRCEEVIK